MKKIILTLFFTWPLLFSFVSGYNMNPQTAFDKEMDELILEGIDYIHDGSYAKALETFQKVINALPEHPAGYFYYAATLEWLIVDHKNFEFQSTFEEYINKAISLSKKMIKKDKEDAMAYLYLGAGYGFRGVYESDYGNFLKAYFDGRRAYIELKKVIKYDPNVYDAYYGIGLYEFYYDFFLKKYIGLSSGGATKEDGIEKVLISIEKGKYSHVEAELTLLRMFYEDGNYDEVVSRAEKMIKRFPNYLFCYWFLGRTYADIGEYEKSFDIYKRIRALLEASPFSNDFSFLEVDYNIAYAFFKRGDYEKAFEITTRLQRVADTIDTRMKYVKKFVEKTKDLHKDIEKVIENNKQ